MTPTAAVAELPVVGSKKLKCMINVDITLAGIQPAPLKKTSGVHGISCWSAKMEGRFG